MGQCKDTPLETYNLVSTNNVCHKHEQAGKECCEEGQSKELKRFIFKASRSNNCSSFYYIPALKLYFTDPCPDPCNPNPCKHGGTCNEGRCTCPENYRGTNCETYIGNYLNNSFYVTTFLNYDFQFLIPNNLSIFEN